MEENMNIWVCTKIKGQYDHGDEKYLIILLVNTIVKSIEQVCKMRQLLPNIAITQLLSS